MKIVAEVTNFEFWITKFDLGYEYNRKCPLLGYILGVLTHTTAWDRLWGVDGALTMWF